MAFEQLGQAVPVEERELGWDDTIEKESAGFIILPEGDYEFKVLEFQRARHEGSEKLPPCNKGMISAFFIGIGLKKHGEPLKMDWPRVVGRKGRAKIGIRMHDGKQYNEIKRFYDPENTAAIAPTAAAPQQQNLYQGQPQATPAFRPGAF